MTDNKALEISCQEAKSLLAAGQIQLLDCREQEERELVAISESVHIPMSEFQDRVEELRGKEDEPIVVHCHHGMRSLQVAEWLRSQGFADVKSMAGGIDRWALEINPTLARY